MTRVLQRTGLALATLALAACAQTAGGGAYPDWVHPASTHLSPQERALIAAE